ncbi:MAG: hypothetical protein NT169_10085 [Chloroflexi bacterium]|nr:hypothetical protein [Chloroflexota bacterium]
MEESRRTALVGGIVLILLGILFLVGQIVPGLWGWVGPLSWPLIVVGVGVLLLLIGLASNAPGMAVPACVVGGIGLLLYWQNATGNWESWAYAWTLIAGFAGVGTVLMGLWTGRWKTIRGGLWSILISLILFAIFASFLGGPFSLGKYWPVLLILLGLLGLGRGFFRQRQ